MRTASRATIAAVTAILGAGCGQQPSAAPDAAAANGASAPPASTDAPPDISGIWSGSFQQSLNENPPMLPETKERFDARNTDDDPLARCKPPGIPRLMNLAFPFEIVQTPDIVYLLMEYDQHTRRVFIGGKHPEELDPTWHGHSVGHWEGRTLVIDTVGFNDQTWLDMRGHKHSDELHVIERYTLSEDGQTLDYEVTIDDPKMYSEPWKSVPKTPHKRSPNMKIQEFICET